MEEYLWLSKAAYHPVMVRLVHPVLRRLGEQHGVRVAIAGPNDGALEPFLAAARSAIDRDVAGVMIMGWEHPRVLAAANAIVRAGIGLVTVETRIPRNRGMGHVGTDWFRLGGAMGDRLAALVGRRGKVLAIGKDVIGHPSVGFRGFLLRMGFNPDIQPIGPIGTRQMPRGEPAEAIARALDEHPDLAGIASLDGESSVWAARLLVARGLAGRVRLVTVGTSDELLGRIREGTVDASFGRKPGTSAFLAFQMLYARRHAPAADAAPAGAFVPGSVDTGFFVITPKNIDTYHEQLDLEEAFEKHKLASQLTLLSSMVRNTSEIALATDAAGRILYSNPATARIAGHDADALGSMSVDELFALPVEAQLALGRCVEQGIGESFEAAVRRADGKQVPVQVSLSPLRVGRDARGAVIVAVDITRRKQAEKDLRESEERFRLLAEQALMGIGILQDDRVQYVNQAVGDILERPVEEILAWRPGQWIEAVHPDDRPRAAENARRQRAGEPDAPRQYSYRVLTATRRVKWINRYSRPIRYRGRPAELVTIVDVTEEKQREEQMRHAHKMEAVGQLAGGIAHDFNNLLTSVLGNAQLLQMQFGEDGEWKEALGEIVRAARRAAELTRQLLTFARRGPVRHEPLDLRRLVRDVIALLAPTVDGRIRLREDLPPEPLAVLGDPSELSNAMMSLALNACDAIAEEGELTFSARAVVLDEADADHEGPPPGPCVELCVADTGEGIAPAVLGRIFEPFFTTKEVGKGTGLGLAAAYGCVRSHGGNITVRSTPGEGTTFRLLFPALRGDGQGR